MSKPGYVSVSLPTRVDEKIDAISERIKITYPGLLVVQKPSRAKIIEYLVDRFLNEGK